MRKYLHIMVMALCLAACSTAEQTLQQVHATDSRHHDTLRTSDSIYIHDSVTVTLIGDTVVKYKERMVYRDRIVLQNSTDTLIKCDTVTTTEYVHDDAARKENQRLKLAIALAILAYLIYWARKHRR